MLIAPFLVLLLCSGAWALNFGADITIFDQREDSRGYFGESDSRTSIGEDNEVEPGMVASQVWDLEGFFLEGFILSMVGGFDFQNGVNGYPGYTSGDIFIDVDGDAEFGTGADSSDLTMGYDYVFDVNWATGNYEVFSISSSDTLERVKEDLNSPESDPWQFYAGSRTDILGSGSIAYGAYSYAADKTFFGDQHYTVTGLDLSIILNDDNLQNWDGVFTSHFTMGCGNDNLMGSGTAPVPEPATLLLFGTGLIGLAGTARKKINNRR